MRCPGEYRVNGVVCNVDAWYRACDVRTGDKLYLAPEDACTSGERAPCRYSGVNSVKLLSAAAGPLRAIDYQ
jgi:hypothetical protein